MINKEKALELLNSFQNEEQSPVHTKVCNHIINIEGSKNIKIVPMHTYAAVIALLAIIFVGIAGFF